MLRAYKYRIYPNEQQKILLSKHFGCARWVYNYGLASKIQAHKDSVKLTCIDICNKLPELKNNKETEWLSEVGSQCLQMSLRNLDNAYTNFFKKTNKFPKFKSKRNHQSFQYPQRVKVDFDNSKVILPKFREGIKCVFDRQFKGKIKTVTVSKTPTNKYFVSILVETNLSPIIKHDKINSDNIIGIDLGIKNFVTTSNGDKYQSPKFLNKKLKKLRRLNRRLSKKKKGSKNREKARIKLAKQYEKITNCRHDYLHKLTHSLTNDNQVGVICVEDLDIKDMMSNKSKSINRHLLDVSIGTFYRMLEYKCEWYGKHLVKIGRFEPSSKLCHQCGIINQELKLQQRNWTCQICGTKHDRDINAAINIKNIALVSREPREFTLVENSNRNSLKQEIK